MRLPMLHTVGRSGMSATFLPMFSTRTFMISWLILKRFIHFEFILVYGTSLWYGFFFMHVPAHFSQYYLLNSLFLLHNMLMPLCQILIDHRDMGLFLGSPFCSLDLCVCSYTSTRLSRLQWPCSIVWYQVLWSLLLCSSFSGLLRLFRVFFSSI